MSISHEVHGWIFCPLLSYTLAHFNLCQMSTKQSQHHLTRPGNMLKGSKFNVYCMSQAGWKSWSQLNWLLFGFDSWSFWLCTHLSAVFFSLWPISQTPGHEEISVFTLWTVSCSDVQEPTDRIIDGESCWWFDSFLLYFHIKSKKALSLLLIYNVNFLSLNYFQYSKDTGHNLCCCIMNLQSEYQQIKVH